MVFLKEYFKNVRFEKNRQMTKMHAKLPSMQRAIWTGSKTVSLPDGIPEGFFKKKIDFEKN